MKLRSEVESKFDQYCLHANLKQGEVSVSIDSIMGSFIGYLRSQNDYTPITKALLGRVLTQRFFKKQNRQTLIQHYFLSKEV